MTETLPSHYFIQHFSSLFLASASTVSFQKLSKFEIYNFSLRQRGCKLFFFPIIPKDEHFYFPKANTSHCIMKYAVEASFSSNGPSPYSYSFLNFNRLLETTANVPFWDIAKSSRRFQTATVCTEQALQHRKSQKQKFNELSSINISNFYGSKGVHKNSCISFGCRWISLYISFS